ncbi:MAG: hypothetical protein Q7R43_01935 [Candidatus Daviesbacteria bacterium]|nr:hypothetical protein [Candidatus Daviesbacteria bacterium]
MNIEQLLSTPKLTYQVPQAGEIKERAKLVAPQPIKLFYGETYDDKGHPIDSMKYYLFVSYLADVLRQEGFIVDPSILIADTAACRNVGEKNEKYYMTLGEERYRFAERVNDVYGTGLRLVKMSHYINSPEFIEKREGIIELCRTDQELMKAVEKTVPESKIEIERSKEFLYSFDEITTIMDLDVKVGPPREDLYDIVARRISRQRGQKELMSLFLTPTFPLGMNWSYFFSNEGIEDHGVTAYKAGSKQLQRNRIVIGRSNPDYVRDLINNSFISTNPVLPNPVLDIGIICEMARKRLDGDNTSVTLANDFYTGRITDDQLKQKIGFDVDTYILSKF